MTLVDLPSPIFWPRSIVSGAAGPTFALAATLDASGEYIAYVFRALENMTISHVGCYLSTASGSPTMTVRIEPVDMTTGVPTGSPWATNTSVTTTTLTTGWRLDALTASATINKDDWYAVKFIWASGTTIALGLFGWTTVLGGSGIPYQVTNVSGSAVVALTSIANLALGSSATSFYRIPQPMMPMTANTARTVNNTSGGRIGLRFQLPFSCRCAGIQMQYGTTVTDIKVIMFDDGGTELSSSQALYDGNTRSTGVNQADYRFSNPVTLSANTWYRAVMEPQTSTNQTLYTITLPSADYSETSWFGVNAHYTTYASGVWTDTATTEIPRLMLILDQLDDGASAGGGGVSRSRVQLGH